MERQNDLPFASKFRNTTAPPETKLTTLSLSGGLGSGCIAEMLVNGDLEVGTDFVAITADPGMEDPRTYDYLDDLTNRLRASGFECRTVKTDLYGELLAAIADPKATRFDFPPFWTRNRETGKRGRLTQKCTQEYKIRPMQRIVRDVLTERHGIGRTSRRMPDRIVRTWIGFSADETMRIKECDQKYVYWQYPLVALGMNRGDLIDYYKRLGRPIPPRSVCNACFANDLPFFKKMAEERPECFEQACKVDDAIRDLTKFDVRDECFVSRQLVPLRKLAEENFEVGDNPLLDWAGCTSGHCFT